MAHLTKPELEAGLAAVRGSPRDEGALTLIVRRPQVGVREVLEEGILDVVSGLVGDNWRARGSSHTPDGSAHPDMQLTIMNARAIDLVTAQERSRWPLAGDQLFVDFSLSEDNVPPGTCLAIGAAVVEVTDEPHTGCGKFTRRFGAEATKFVNSAEGRALHLRGVNARVIRTGPIRIGDVVRKSS